MVRLRPPYDDGKLSICHLNTKKTLKIKCKILTEITRKERVDTIAL